MEEEKPIFCLEHCKGNKIFGFKIPSRCPYCAEDLSTCELRIPPFRVPTPFTSGKNSPCSIILKPTKGDFLTDYKKADNLHMGVVSSQGIVYEFDTTGLRFDRTSTWERCLAIKNLHNMDHDSASWSQYWDFTLNVVAGQENWKKIRYDEDRNNCFSFVLAFLRALQSPQLNVYVKDRRLFCEKFILPKTAFAAKYITLYRKLSK